MKKILFLVIGLVLLATSCSKDKSKNGLNPYDTAVVKAGQETKSLIFDDLTSYQDSIDAIFEVAKFSAVIKSPMYESGGGVLGLNENEINRVKKEFTLQNMWVVDQLMEGGEYSLGRIAFATEVIIQKLYTDGHGFLEDTIAYIPSKILIETGKKVQAAFAAEDYDECRRLLKESYVFKPIDAKGYEALKAAGLN